MKRRLLSLTILLTALFAVAQTEPAPGSLQLIQPAELVKAMQSSGGQKPVVLYVGPRLIYTQAHIPGAEYIGPVGRAEGMDKLQARAKSLPHDCFIVIYCGCCPWEHCPNIRPAYHELTKQGFTKVRVLYLATSLGTDWADKGYPIAKGE